MAKTGIGTLECDSPRKQAKALSSILKAQVTACRKAEQKAIDTWWKTRLALVAFLETIHVAERNGLPDEVIKVLQSTATPYRKLCEECATIVDGAEKNLQAAIRLFEENDPSLSGRAKRWWRRTFSKKEAS